MRIRMSPRLTRLPASTDIDHSPLHLGSDGGGVERLDGRLGRVTGCDRSGFDTSELDRRFGSAIQRAGKQAESEQLRFDGERDDLRMNISICLYIRKSIVSPPCISDAAIKRPMQNLDFRPSSRKQGNRNTAVLRLIPRPFGASPRSRSGPM